MRVLGASLAVLFAVVLAVPAGAATTGATAGTSVVSSAELDQALAARRDADSASRALIRNLLQREQVRALARDAGLDLRRAEAGVATLRGDELRSLASKAAAADSALAGGQTIQISLVAALLIVIIVILLVK